MAGGLLNLVATGKTNCILNGNPSKTFFKSAYKKYTNFGLQKIRLDKNSSHKSLNITGSIGTQYTFDIKSHGDLLMDTYIVVNLPTIWSGGSPRDSGEAGTDELSKGEFRFKWIEDIGTQMIDEITINKFAPKIVEGLEKLKKWSESV